MKLLVVNPNTTVAVSELLGRRIGAAVGAAAEVEAITARFGAAYIASEASCVVAAHAALDACSAHADAHGRPDAIVVGCFGDPGVFALREALALPVIGLAEAAMREAATHGRFAIVTGGAAWGPMLERLARALDLADRLATIEIVAATGAELAADPERAIALLGAACARAARSADAVVLGGATLAGMADAIAPTLAVPLVDSVDAAARAAVATLAALAALR
ncbi:MAG TPA: aspartate/glutamate racemase family protein [Caldimonas sp.]|jgi:Asp/Glu/hydantoin racemase|nr:aspartate/glutamate racemase family protein [Caldimonas sp.]